MSGSVTHAVCLISGIVAMGLGIVLSRAHLRQVARANRKHGLVHAAMPDGWGVWFFQGFADVTMGTRWAVALAILLAWSGVGLGLITVGMGLWE